MSMMNPKVDAVIAKEKKWKEEMMKLRAMVLDCGLTEELKWGVPCYTYNDGNVLLIHGFKEYCALLFFKGALLSDNKKILIQQTANVQSGRQIRFTGLQEILKMEKVLIRYIFEAIEVEKAGLKIEYKKTEDFVVVEEFQDKLNKMPALKKAFEALTPGRQKAYLLFFSSAKQPQTRVTRIENNIDRIMKGIGLNDCTCGLSKKKPTCDGSHKLLRK